MGTGGTLIYGAVTFIFQSQRLLFAFEQLEPASMITALALATNIRHLSCLKMASKLQSYLK